MYCTLNGTYITACFSALALIQDECSFVSLRDVERAMIVFKFFIDKRDLFKDLVVAKSKDDVRNHTHNSYLDSHLLYHTEQDSSAGSFHLGFSTCSQYLLSCSTTGQERF